MTLHLEILLPEQRLFWDKYTHNVPKKFVLYGGTAVALRYGHRRSIDFDFFSDGVLDHDNLLQSLPILRDGEILQKGRSELVVRVLVNARPIKLNFLRT